MPSMTAEVISTKPCPWVAITIQGLTLAEQTITVWRVADGEREAVKGARDVGVVDSFYAEDYKAPLNRTVRYELEVVSGVDGEASVDVVVESESGFIQDPLDPSTAVPVYGDRVQSGEAYFRASSFTDLQYVAPSSRFQVMGSRYPVSIGGQRQAASGVPFAMSTTSETETLRMRALLMSCVHLVVRPLPEWGSYLPGVGTYEAASVSEQPMDVAYGGTLTRWETTGDLVRPSSAGVIVSRFTFQDDAELFATFADKQAAVGGGTYLEDQKSPTGAES